MLQMLQMFPGCPPRGARSQAAEQAERGGSVLRVLQSFQLGDVESLCGKHIPAWHLDTLGLAWDSRGGLLLLQEKKIHILCMRESPMALACDISGRLLAVA